MGKRMMLGKPDKRTVFMFSGQGSQYYQMGRELYEGHPGFRFWMDRCDEIAQPMIHASLRDLLYGSHGKGDVFDRLLYTNPGLLSIQYSLSKTLMEMGIVPDLLLGYSLGEVAAAVLAGGIPLESGIGLVVDIARVMEEKAVPARMLAVIEPLEIMAELPHLFRDCRLIGKNFPGNFVMCGPIERIQRLQEGLQEKKKVSQLLPVRYGFHTEMMDSVEADLKDRIGRLAPSPFGIPVLSSGKGRIIRRADGEYLWDVFRSPVDFQAAMATLLEQGDFRFVDVGPSGSLAMFVKYILPPGSQSLPLPILNQFGRDLAAMERLKAAFPDAAGFSHPYQPSKELQP